MRGWPKPADMSEVLRTSQAETDLADIWLHIAEDSLEAADREFARFEAVFHLLSTQPEMGVRCRNWQPPVRRFPVGNYLIFYRPTSQGIEVLRVLHGARDIIDLL